MKPDSEEIRQFLDELAKTLKLYRLRSRWVRFAFHFTDVRNAVEILKTERIRCRADLERENALPVDIASPKIISVTDETVKETVRLYFRPLTPTQFHMEGIRPLGEIWNGCHCPVPVFFLFDLWEILSRDDSMFSEGNLAILGSQGLCSTTDELKKFSFGDIYHVGRYSEDERSNIISHRNAEIVIPKKLDLTSLKFIYCRTPAEKETLLHLLPPHVINKWGSRIIVESSANLFKRNWAFVQKVNLSSQLAILEFSPDANVAGPFELRVVRKGKFTKDHKRSEFYATGKLPLEFEAKVSSYEIEVYLDSHLAYAGSYSGTDDIPF